MKANSLKTSVVVAVVVAVEFSFLKIIVVDPPPPVSYVLFQLMCPSRGSHLMFSSGKVLVLKLAPWPPVYNNNGSRLILPHNLLKNRALA